MKNVTSITPSNFIFVALACEAKPLIQAWRLKKLPKKQVFTIYRNAETVVVVTGIGKIAMAAAVAYTMAQFADVMQPIMLNLGIAGHPHQAVGSCFLADKIIDAETQRRFYPQLPFELPCRTLPLKTLSKADIAYTGDNLSDMEASAFYEIAAKFSTGELIQSLKVVSDNKQSSLADINQDLVAGWITAELTTIEKLVSALTKLRGILPAPNTDLYQTLLNRIHFTASNAVKLQTLLSRWHLLKPDAAIDLESIGEKNGKALIAWLEEQLETVEFYL
ncbi:hypothetical protein QZJ86_20750 [Methylomonas montana]|uniref:5'-methylthioadenosine/S-adenosylhomocysteine nucleosidase family protein n=1 Tax=Methylomonas montana TaxID=3058963 RepID=UPI002658132C|nr:hypothetical protein [Methylomonas montana]WKJ90407.1 hypothetical protein QZJ86_20750 [Methylomonas montana]